MVAKKPNQRFQTATNLLEAIRQLEEKELSSFQKTTTNFDSIQDTAIATHWDHRSDPGTLPEAIVPNDDVEIIDDVEVVSPPIVNTTRPDVIYVGNTQDANANPVSAGLPKRLTLTKDQSNLCLLLSSLSCVTAVIPILGTIAPWMSWRLSRRLVKEKKAGLRSELRMRTLKTAKLISILSFVAALFVSTLTTIFLSAAFR